MKIKREAMTIAVTGHRPGKIEEGPIILGKLFEKTFLEAEPEAVIVGMCDGADLIAGIAAIKTSFPVWAVIPYPEHEESKYNTDPESYKYVKSFAQKVIVLPGGKTPAESFDLRNKWMVDNATHLLAYFDGSKSGTKNTVDYAKSKGMKVRNLYGKRS